MDKLFKLEIITPEQSIFKGEVVSVIVPAYEGYLGVLAGHAPFVCSLTAGEIITRGEGSNRCWSVGGGLMEVVSGQVTILSESAERSEQIDVNRAEQARQRALKRIYHPEPDINLPRAMNSLLRAENRIRFSTKHQESIK
ncbi:MAG: ATP synthase F1 subunit epsilon [Planctomycetota bacterium]